MAKSSRTPVMVLQELTVQRNLPPPEYNISFQNTGTHINRFDYVVNVSGITAKGSGPSKQIGKHQAALNALKKLEEIGLYDSATEPVQAFKAELVAETDSPSSSSTIAALNYIVEIQNLCLENKLPSPEFKEVCSVGPPHNKEFTYECIVSSVVSEAVSGTKKLAKQLAAKNMISKIKEVLPELCVTYNTEQKRIAEFADADTDQIAWEKFEELTDVVFNKNIKLEDYLTNISDMMHNKDLTYDDFKEELATPSLENLEKICNRLEIKYRLQELESRNDPIYYLHLYTDSPFTTISTGTTQEEAKEKKESDLVFETKNIILNLKNSRISRDSSNSNRNVESSQSLEDDEKDHWLSNTVNRIKRSIGNIFTSSEKPEERNPKVNKKPSLITHSKLNNIKLNEDGHHKKLNRNNRNAQAEYEDEEDEDEYGQEEDNDDEYQPRGDGQIESNDYEIENVDENNEEDINTGGLGVDDEDFDVNEDIGSGKDGSGEIEEITTTTTVSSIQTSDNLPTEPRYYRFSITVQEVYLEEHRNRNSGEFLKIADAIERGIYDIFANSHGSHFPTVISIEKLPSDAFKVRVTVDLKSLGDDEETVRKLIHDEIYNKHMIGNLIIDLEDFKFRAFEGEPNCNENELKCANNQCINISLRCDGVRDCSDNSDEVGCPPTTPLPPLLPTTPETQPPFIDPVSENVPTSKSVEEVFTSSENTSAGVNNGGNDDNVYRPEDIPGSGDGDDNLNRADDIQHCANLIGFYHGDQKCDGRKDCDDGSDEKNCGTGEDHCIQGEYGCDISRCIPMSNRCNGIKDCDDNTDEAECQDCGFEAFHCDFSTCIPKGKVCDGATDCQDGTDEIDCKGTAQYPTCLSTEFDCGNGQCIPHYLRCSGNVECSNGADEHNCELESGEGSSDRFQCQTGQLISSDKRCDRIYDCYDGSDEKNCPCLDTDFHCHNTFCIPSEQRCDGVRNCQDGSDEFNCQNSSSYTTNAPPTSSFPPRCYLDQIQCRDGSCVNGTLCDRHYDCVDGTDEAECHYCSFDEFRCNDGSCINKQYHCDRRNDCSDGSDEENCGQTCLQDEIDCGNGKCVHENYKCDGFEDCPNGLDERDCDCPSSQFRCSDGSCIPRSSLCNHFMDCADGADEQNCRTTTCSTNEFRCEKDNSCIPSYQRCDRIPQCSDGADESWCPCNNYEFKCSNGQCVDERLRCNGRPDCNDYSDESNCSLPPLSTSPPFIPPTVTVSPKSCPFGYVSCSSDDQCIQRSQLCDGRVDCRDVSDESNCEAGAAGLQLRTYPSEQQIGENQEVVFQCRDEGPIRAKVEWRRANGLPLPPDSRDINGRLEMPNIRVEHGGTYVCVAKGFPPGTPGAEIAVQLHVEKAPIIIPPPPVKCYVNESTCANGDCIGRNKVCDGSFDCSDGSDETKCQHCEPNEFKCDNKKCITAVWKCDGQDDCTDGSDERDCRPAIPGQGCGSQQFTCRNEQCVPRSFHCDSYPDCMDRSDEIGCTAPIVTQNPPNMLSLNVGQTFTITCRAVGVPTPQIMWRLNWHHVPAKCRMTSEDGFGTLTCENIQVEDEGAYSCEALSSMNRVFAAWDTILTINKQSVCRPGYFNVDAREEAECIKCFCFGHTTNCRSADLFIFQFQPPFDSLKVLGARIDRITGVVDIRDEPIYKGEVPVLTPVGAHGVRASLPYYVELNQPDVVPYFALPETYHRNQLKSYGGYLKYSVQVTSPGRPIIGPDVIIAGNGYVLLHESNTRTPIFQVVQKRVRFFDGEWLIKSNTGAPSRPATREEMMMVLEDVTQILIKLAYTDDILNTTISNIEMDSAAIPDSGLGVANYVEECSCPVGYSGASCENCADGYVRHESGQWLGQCYREPINCAPGSYFDGKECQICPCPYPNLSNQFARTCRLNTDGSVLCDCQAGYEGLRCEICAQGYSGNPLVPGDSCRPSSLCDPNGTIRQDSNGRCICKQFTSGPYCELCQESSFHLSARNQFGCISCFCMGVTRECSSSDWYRDTIATVFTSSVNEFRLTDINKEQTITDGIFLNQVDREISFNSFRQPAVYYWSLPSKYLGDKITAYGGYLKYTIRNTPVPGGASSRNTAPDIELVSENHISLQYFASNINQSTNSPQTFVVPLLEQYWQRHDGLKSDREHLLMALADVKAIYIKATYFTNTQEAALISVSLDIATEYNTGRERAYEVEKCHCPPGHTGLSCEDCAFGYTRSDEGIYLETCKPCECNGYSNECDTETGECRNCRDNTAGEHCDQCIQGFSGDPTRGQSCTPVGPPPPCNCNYLGSTGHGCVNGVCQCKANVEGPSCDRCRNGTFGLSADNIEGCEFCFCSGVAQECSGSQLYTEQIPIQITENNGFILTDQFFKVAIRTDFKYEISRNEIGFSFLPSQRELMYWSLPSIFTGNQIKSYGGKLEYKQRFFEYPQSKYYLGKDIIITGNNVVIYWSNPKELQPGILNEVSVKIHPSTNWLRLDQNRVPKSASREDFLTVLANIETILIRATLSTDLTSTFLSDIVLDTAVDVYTGQPLASSVEICRCPVGYRGTSCESCSSGYYKEINYLGSLPLGSCNPCPCNRREESCEYDSNIQRVICNCQPGYSGPNCEKEGIITPTRRPNATNPTAVPPTIEVVILGNNIQIYEIGGSVRINCSAVSRISQSVIHINWKKDDDRLPYNAIDDGSGILYIRNLTASDSGRYTCEAEDGYSVVTQSITIVVGDNKRDQAPIISLSSPIVQASEGQLIEVRCSATGAPLPRYVLSRVDGQPLNPGHSFENGIFRIYQSRSTDAGQYQCTAINHVGQDSQSFDIQVTTGSVLRVEIEPNQFNGQTGDEVVLRCIANRAQNLRWIKESGNLPYQYREENGVLIIPNAQSSDSGNYICTATSYDGTRGTQTVSVYIQGSREVYPSVEVSKDRTTLRQGDNFEVRCEGTGSPTPSVKWTKYNVPLEGNAEQIGNTLYLKNAKIENRGVYTCAVSNKLGTVQDSVTIEVTRFEAPLVQILPEGGTISVTEGNVVQLQCRVVQGYPPPSVTWSRSDGRSLSSRVEIMSGENLRIMDTTQEEAGDYTCLAHNDAGTATAITHITVYTAPVLTVSPNEDTILRPLGSQLELLCYASGFPAPSVNWLKPHVARYDQSVSSASQLSNGPARLEFSHLRSEDAGVYTCIGENQGGQTEKRVRVDILPERGDNPGGDQGSSPANVQEFVATAGSRAIIKCNVTSSDNIQHITDWVRIGNPLPDSAHISQGVLYIENVQTSAAGEYECLTYDRPQGNIVFRIRSRLRVLSPPRITLDPIKQTVEPGQNAYINCVASGDQPILIEWFPVNRTMPTSVYTTAGYIRFSHIHYNDAGKYRCLARNSAGEADSVAEVVVASQPEARPPSENHIVNSPPGKTVDLHCRHALATEPYPQVDWRRENGELLDNSRVEGSTLRIYNLRKENEGRYICTVHTPVGILSEYVILNVEGPSVKALPETPNLHISPESMEYPAGSNIDIRCQSTEPGVIPTWSKLSGSTTDNNNVQYRAGQLNIYNAKVENSGSYRCEATGQKDGYPYYKDHILVIKALEDPTQDEIPVQVQRAKRRASVRLDCNTDMDGPVTYFWSKQGGTLPYYVDEYSKTIQLNSIGAIDAGTYICSASNQYRTLDIPIILAVTDIIPYFTQAPNSYITLQTLPDPYMKFNLEISFKPENDYGLILYNGNREKERDGDFISLALNNGIPEFKMNLGPATPITIVRGNESIADRQWHTIKLIRFKKRVTMYVDGKGPFINESEGKYVGLDLSEPLFLGSVPNYDNISPHVMIDRGLVGCISKFKIAYNYQDILRDALNTTGVTNCETCTENKCENQGTCQEALTTEGYTCICPTKFSGPTCNKRKGQACSPYSCGVGRCIDTEFSYTCQCPLGRSGRNCEKTIQVFEPAFRDNAYIAYPPPKQRSLKRTKIEMKIKPRTTSDGLLLYSAETNEGHGDFMSLAIRDHRIEFAFEIANGLVVSKNDFEINPNKWTDVVVIKSAQDVRIIVDGHPSPAVKYSQSYKSLSLATPIYVGGYDQYSIKLHDNVKVNKGFNGCILDINIYGFDSSTMKNITDSSNVEDCGNDDDIDNGIPTDYLEYKQLSYDNNRKTGCSNSPCKNGALCFPVSSVDYKCSCPAAFSGKDCDHPVDLCATNPCQNDGICRYNNTGFLCDCRFGYGGHNCEQRVEIRNDVHFDGNGWLEFTKSLLPHTNNNEVEIIALEFSTNSSNGVIFWQGQTPNEDGHGQDYIYLALINGYLEYSFDLGSGPAIIRNGQIKVDDGERHSVILKRVGNSGQIDIDHSFIEEGNSEGEAQQLDCDGNMFLGGTPNIRRMSGNKFSQGFDGCIHGFELQQSKTLDLGMKAIDGLNVKPCSSFNFAMNNMISKEELVN